MKDNKAVIIKGKLYDSTTGLPIEKPIQKTNEITSNKTSTVVTTTHKSLAKRSQAIYQRASQKTALHGKPLVRKIGRSMDIARSKSIARFSHIHKATDQPKPQPAKRHPDIKHIVHPMVARAEHIRSLKKLQSKPVEVPKTSKHIKEEAINEALKKASETKQPKKPNFFKRHHRFINIFSISIFLIIMTGYITYLYMPNISVIVASTQAGINAKYPEYVPDGYKISGPVSYQNGEVTIDFRANTGSNKFLIKQAKSSWDSSAVKNMVNKDSKGEFITTEERGLTIFTYNGNAAWVNGGILYTISGNATLSSDQVRRIATSL
jgi:hypothetical protein